MDEGWVELGSAKRDIENLDTTTDGFLKKSNWVKKMILDCNFIFHTIMN